MEKRTVDRIFMIFALIIGLLLFGISANSFSVMNNNCTSAIIQDGFLIVMVIGAIMATLAISYGFCVWRGGACYSGQASDNASEFYMSVFASLASVLAILLLTMGIKLSELPECTAGSNGNKLKVNIWFMFALCVVIAGVSGMGVNYMMRDKASA